MTVAVANDVILLMRQRGEASYFGEPVSQLEHALQAAWLASRAGASRQLVLAALLHDAGHLLHNSPESIASEGVDTQHEIAGYDWILRRFGPAVAEPVRYHVAAKRYLCAVEPEYRATLSPASLDSLQLQGGPMDEGQIRAFEALRCYREAVVLRRWDDEAKVPGLVVPGIEEYREIIESECLPLISPS